MRRPRGSNVDQAQRWSCLDKLVSSLQLTGSGGGGQIAAATTRSPAASANPLAAGEFNP